MGNSAIKVSGERHHGWGDHQRTFTDDECTPWDSARGDAALSFPGDVHHADATSFLGVNRRVWALGEQLFASLWYGDAGGHSLVWLRSPGRYLEDNRLGRGSVFACVSKYFEQLGESYMFTAANMAIWDGGERRRWRRFHDGDGL